MLTDGGAWRPASVPSVLGSPKPANDAPYSPLPLPTVDGYAVAGDIAGEEELPMDDY